jgi:hypothetical protein
MNDEKRAEARPAVVPTTSAILPPHTDDSRSEDAGVVLNNDAVRFVRETFMEAGAEAMMFALLNAGREMSAEAARTIWVHPRFAEVVKRRQVDHEPCPTRCRRCSRCVHSLAYWARGGRDYRGQANEDPVPSHWRKPERHLRVVSEAS